MTSGSFVALASGVAELASVAGMVWAVRGRASSVFGPSVWRGPKDRRALALTFDDGPSEATPQLLDLLAGYGARATFFQVGENVRRLPEVARAVSHAGHEIGNHSNSHLNCAFEDRDRIHSEFRTAQSAIVEVTGQKPVWLRAPYGVRWRGFKEVQSELGLTGVMWTVIGRDWKLPAKDIAARVLDHAGPGCIICLHDGRATLKNPNVEPMLEAVRHIVPELLRKGYQFETLSDLLCPKN